MLSKKYIILLIGYTVNLKSFFSEVVLQLALKSRNLKFFRTNCNRWSPSNRIDSFNRISSMQITSSDESFGYRQESSVDISRQKASKSSWSKADKFSRSEVSPCGWSKIGQFTGSIDLQSFWPTSFLEKRRHQTSDQSRWKREKCS